MIRVHVVECAAPADRVWELISRPDRWSQWSPHVSGAEGLGSPHVVEGASGRVILRGGLRIAARVTAVTPGESWSWQVGGLSIDHVVRPSGGGSRLEHVVEGSAGAWPLVAIVYAPAVGLIARNIARVAERGP